MTATDGNKTPTCDECWAVPATVEVDAGMFGYKDLCGDCYAEYYKPRPITQHYGRTT